MMLNEEQRDMLTELMNIGVGHAAGTLNAMIGHKVQLVVPEIRMLQPDQIDDAVPGQGFGRLASVSMGFNGPFDGYSSLIFPAEAAKILVATLTDEQPAGNEALGDVRSATLTEIGNILLNGVMGTIGNMLQSKLRYSVPEYHETELHRLIGRHCDGGGSLLVARTNFTIDQLQIEGYVFLFFGIDSFDQLLARIDHELAA